MEEKKRKPGSGGKRPGSGPKPKSGSPGVIFSVRIDPEIKAWISQSGNPREYIERLVSDDRQKATGDPT